MIIDTHTHLDDDRYDDDLDIVIQRAKQARQHSYCSYTQS